MKADVTLDLRGVSCPMNWVKTKLQLEELAPGQIVEILLNDSEGVRNVPVSARAEGHRIVEVIPQGNEFRIFIQRSAEE